MEHTLATSGDGSNTLQLTRFNETYHSRNGAFTEASHIYIRCGVEYLFEKGLQSSSGAPVAGISASSGMSTTPERTTPPAYAPSLTANTGIPEPTVSGLDISDINIFDVGLGTALNCILTWCWQQQLIRSGLSHPQIAYYGIEKYPIPPQEALQMNYPQVIAGHMGIILHPEEISSAFEKIHACEWEKDVEITPGFTLHKSCADISLLQGDYYSAGKYSSSPAMIFYDTFSPATQPELWDESIFRAIASGCAPGSILTTYCSKGTVKQALRNAGFTLERLSGPPGKRHILRGVL